MAPQRTTIKRKLMTAIMTTSIVVLVLTCTVFIVYEVITFREGLVRGLTTRAEIIAANSTAALAFDNEVDATEVLAAFRKDPRMVAACLYDRDGRVFAKYPADVPTDIFPVSPKKTGHRFEKDHFIIFTPVLQGNQELGTVYMKSNLSALRERYRFYAVLVLSVITASILLAFLLSIWLQKRIAEPILNLANSARGVSERRDYSLRTQKVTDDEIGLLTDSFNDMLTEIQQRETSLHEGAARMRAILESALDCIITMDHEGRIVEFNPAAEKMFGHQRSQAVGAILADLIIPPTLRRKHQEGMARYLATREAPVLGKRLVLSALRADGREFPVELAITRISQEGPPMFTGFIRDITERERAEQEIRQLNAELEQRVTERTAQLASVNKELEAFSYSVSHDLRAPLRHIRGFAQMLEEDRAVSLNEKSRHYLDIILTATKQMSTLIDDLLSFSRTGRAELRKQRVNLNTLVEEVRRDLEPECKGRSITWSMTPLPEVEADPAMMRQVFVNLIANAIKYTSKRPDARIEISYDDTQNDGRVFYIRDNGVGFDMAYVDKLFGVFQRLHSGDEFEGTGIGLANVHRIIARHGGRTWAEGKVGQGATFFFSLPQLKKGEL